MPEILDTAFETARRQMENPTQDQVLYDEYGRPIVRASGLAATWRSRAIFRWLRRMRKWQSLALIGGLGIIPLVAIEFAVPHMARVWGILGNVAALLLAFFVFPAWWVAAQQPNRWTRVANWTFPVSFPVLFSVASTWAMLVVVGVVTVFVYRVVTE